MLPLVLGVLLSACDSPPDAESAPTLEERLADWESLPEGTAVPVSLAFDAPLPDSGVAGLLERHSLRPYAVYATAAGMQTVQSRERSRASLEVLAEAREQAITQLRTSLCAHRGHARSMLAANDAPADSVEAYRAVLAGFLRIQRALPELERGAPLIYGVESVGSVADVRAVASEATVKRYEPGWRGRIGGADTVVVPPPTPGAGGPIALDPEIAALTPEDVRGWMERLADDGFGACEDASRPDVEGR